MKRRRAARILTTLSLLMGLAAAPSTSAIAASKYEIAVSSKSTYVTITNSKWVFSVCTKKQLPNGKSGIELKEKSKYKKIKTKATRSARSDSCPSTHSYLATYSLSESVEGTKKYRFWSSVSSYTNFTVEVKKKLKCQYGGACKIGDIGPGTGTVYYVSNSGFACGPTLQSTCHYLELALDVMSGYEMSTRSGLFCERDFNMVSNPNVMVSSEFAMTIGTGLKNSNLLAQECQNSAFTWVRSYVRGGKSDWFIPSIGELTPLQSQSGLIEFKTSYGWPALPVRYLWSSTPRATDLAWGLCVNDILSRDGNGMVYFSRGSTISPCTFDKQDYLVGLIAVRAF